MTTKTIAEMSLSEIQDEIASLAARVTAATGRMLELLAALDRMDPGVGFKSAAHWYSWRTGIDLPAAREHVRVARKLRDLPETAAAVSNGELAYSKARAITRVAKPENEAKLIEWAKEASTSQLERIVRGVRTVRENQLDESAVMEHRRHLTYFWDDHGMLDVRARLSPEEGALFIKALERAQADLYAEKKLAQVKPGDRASALARVCDRALHGVGTTPSDRTQVIVHVDAEVLANPAAEGRSAIQDGPSVSGETSQRLACDASVVIMAHGPDGQVLDVGRKSRRIHAALRRAVLERDHYMCTFPGCNCRDLEGHHLEPWTAGGKTERSNLAFVCRRHHVLVHEFHYRVIIDNDRVRYFHPSGYEILQAPPPPRDQSPLEPVTDCAEEARVLQALWDGIGHIDYDDAIEAMA